MSIYMSLCPGCYARQHAERCLTPIGREYIGSCQGVCMGAQGRVQQYELGPTWAEIERIRRRKKREEAHGGGERSRAGRRRE